jgi:hypothetical protein
MSRLPWLRAVSCSTVAAGLWLMAACLLAVEETDTQIAKVLEKAGENRSEIQKALDEVPEDQSKGMRFIVVNMPETDLKTLSAEFLLENCEYAYRALSEAAWSDQLPEEVFFNNLLPYANINERRDRWRVDFYNRFKPWVADDKTPSEAAAILNQKVFPELGVKYSTKRKKADQSPYETLETGLASCTGLSVLLVDACRAVGIPARIVGTPLWSDRSGNHTWVEIWDEGWHFTGACEPTGNDLDRGWFTARASTAQRDHRLHAIYAVTFKNNGQTFPMVWDRDNTSVFAVNVTDRYTEKQEALPEGHATVRFRFLSSETQERQIAQIVVKDQSGTVLFEGKTNDERFDANDHLTTTLPIGTEFIVTANAGAGEQQLNFGVKEGQQLITLESK